MRFPQAARDCLRRKLLALLPHPEQPRTAGAGTAQAAPRRDRTAPVPAPARRPDVPARAAWAPAPRSAPDGRPTTAAEFAPEPAKRGPPPAAAAAASSREFRRIRPP